MTDLADKAPDTLWLQDLAESLDCDNRDADQTIPQLGAQGFFRIGVSENLGGAGGTTADAVEAIARVASRSVAAAFVFWGQRSFIEYVLQSPNSSLRERWLPDLLSGREAGATGLSNAIKFLSGIENLQILASKQTADSWLLNGLMPWVTNLRPQGFIVAAAVARTSGEVPMVVALGHDHLGLTRTEDLNLVALRGTNTAAIQLKSVAISREDLLHENAQEFIGLIRPSFLALQCGMSLGLAEASLLAAQHHSQRSAGRILLPAIHALKESLSLHRDQLLNGLNKGTFVSDPRKLFDLRIALADIVRDALQLELEASGGRAYLQDQNRDFIRRWRESAFIPLITPSLVQLRGELQKHRVAL
jgi:alkylation response protein AidB-like acyl-CoA dehydrogenase